MKGYSGQGPAGNSAGICFRNASRKIRNRERLQSALIQIIQILYDLAEEQLLLFAEGAYVDRVFFIDRRIVLPAEKIIDSGMEKISQPDQLFRTRHPLIELVSADRRRRDVQYGCQNGLGHPAS